MHEKPCQCDFELLEFVFRFALSLTVLYVICIFVKFF